MAVLEAQDAVARAQGIDERSLPSSCCAAREDHRFALLRLEDTAQARPNLGDEARHLRTAVIRDGPVHRTEDPLRDVRGAGNLQEVAT